MPQSNRTWACWGFGMRHRMETSIWDHDGEGSEHYGGRCGVGMLYLYILPLTALKITALTILNKYKNKTKLTTEQECERRQGWSGKLVGNLVPKIKERGIKYVTPPQSKIVVCVSQIRSFSFFSLIWNIPCISFLSLQHVLSRLVLFPFLNSFNYFPLLTEQGTEDISLLVIVKH